MNSAICLLLMAVVAVGYYVSACLFWPYASCWWCKGDARRPAWWGGRAFRLCGWCRGSGRRLRLGRKVWNYFRRVRGNASKGDRS